MQSILYLIHSQNMNKWSPPCQLLNFFLHLIFKNDFNGFLGGEHMQSLKWNRELGRTSDSQSVKVHRLMRLSSETGTIKCQTLIFWLRGIWDLVECERRMCVCYFLYQLSKGLQMLSDTESMELQNEAMCYTGEEYTHDANHSKLSYK